MSCLTVWPASIFADVVPSVQTWLDVFVRGAARDERGGERLHRWLVWPARTTVLGCWLAAIVLPLDWDRPWQQWPVPCVYGALLGYALGLALAALSSWR